MSTVIKSAKKGDKLSYTQFFIIEGVNSDSIHVKDESGRSIVVQGEELINEMSSSSLINETRKVSRSEAVEIFKSFPKTAMTVNFNLKVKAEDVVKELKALYPNKGKIVSKTDYDKQIAQSVKDALEGKERTMVGRHYGSFDDFGRVTFIDMDLPKDTSKSYDTRTRQVDPRTINWLVVNGVKYEVK